MAVNNNCTQVCPSLLDEPERYACGKLLSAAAKQARSPAVNSNEIQLNQPCPLMAMTGPPLCSI